MIRRARFLVIALAALACSDATGPSLDPPRLGNGDVLVMFVGNSLTFTYDVPALVQAMADADGRSFSHVSMTRPGATLDMHYQGLVPDQIQELRPDIVVLQEGSAATEAGREHLVHWTAQFAELIRAAGGEPALYMTWPPSGYEDYFVDSWASYKIAADSVGGLFIPAGWTWVEAWKLDSDLELYGPDGGHQSYLGALAAAQTIYASLYGLPADSIPALDDGVAPATVALLRRAVARSLATTGY